VRAATPPVGGGRRRLSPRPQPQPGASTGAIRLFRWPAGAGAACPLFFDQVRTACVEKNSSPMNGPIAPKIDPCQWRFELPFCLGVLPFSFLFSKIRTRSNAAGGTRGAGVCAHIVRLLLPPSGNNFRSIICLVGFSIFHHHTYPTTH
jgi:hypothetical protein